MSGRTDGPAKIESLDGFVLGFVGTGTITASIVTGLCAAPASSNRIWLSPRNAGLPLDWHRPARRQRLPAQSEVLDQRRRLPAVRKIAQDVLRKFAGPGIASSADCDVLRIGSPLAARQRRSVVQRSRPL
jgi:hypothetical protein